MARDAEFKYMAAFAVESYLLWEVVSEAGDGTSEWSDYDGFCNFMCRYLV